MEGSQAPKPEPGKVIEPKLTKVGSLEEIRSEGYTAFAMGPVYVYGDVRDDLVASFATERDPGRPADVFATTARFERPVLAACRDWSFVLSLMDTTSFQWFKQWMLGLQLVDRGKRTFWVARHYSAPILDPFLLDAGKEAKGEAIDLFSLSGLKGQIIPVHGFAKHEDAPEYVKFMVRPPEEEVVRVGKAALEVLDGS